MTHGHLWDRLAEAKSRLKPVQSKYRVLFEDPNAPDEPAKVLVPDPNWMAAALAGNILPSRTTVTAIYRECCCCSGCIVRTNVRWIACITNTV